MPNDLYKEHGTFSKTAKYFNLLIDKYIFENVLPFILIIKAEKFTYYVHKQVKRKTKLCSYKYNFSE